MAKPRYLVGKPGDQKFKRNIPASLQPIAGKTAFVERVRGKSVVEIRQQGSLFAVNTDAQLRTFRAQLSSGILGASSPKDGLDLSVVQARQIAVSYFLKRHQANLLLGNYFSSHDDPDFPDLLSDAGEATIVALREASGEQRTTDPRAVKLLVEHRIISELLADRILSEGWPRSLKAHRPFQLLCRLLERADLELASRRYRSLNLGTLVPVGDSLFVDAEGGSSSELPAREPRTSKTVADLKVLFHQTKTGVTRSRSSQYRIPFRILEEGLGEKHPLSDIERDKCRELMEFLPKVPSHAAQHYPRATLKEAAELFRQKTGSYADRPIEARKHVAILKSAFDLATQEGWIDKNPWDGIKVAMPRTKKFVTSGSTYEPFSIPDLNKLFSLPLFTGCIDDEHGCHTVGPNIPMRHRYWAPILALWTGMRMNEILQLEKADICRSTDDIAYICVTDEEHGDYAGTGFEKRLKTTNAIRNIPIHHLLINSGFLHWVASSPDGRLFPEALTRNGEKPSDVYSKRFANNAKFAGVWKSRRLVFHSFRNNFNDALRNAGVSLELREAINGWREQGKMDRRYGQGQTIQRLKEAVDSVRYEGLQVRHLFDNSARLGPAS